MSLDTIDIVDLVNLSDYREYKALYILLEMQGLLL